MADFILKYWLQAAFGLVVYMLVIQYRKACGSIKTALEQNDALKLGVQALLRDRIIQCYNHYQQKGYCPIYARENLDALYKNYKALGGNGTITHLVEEIREMKVEEPKDGFKFSE